MGKFNEGPPKEDPFMVPRFVGQLLIVFSILGLCIWLETLIP